MFYEAFLAGIWASIGSTLGKLTGTTSVVGESYIIWGGLLITMVIANTWGCRHYLRSLDAASNTVAPTIISAASSYVLSGVIGITLFEEVSSVRWWAGATMIVFGLALVARPRDKQKTQ
ncbi:transmembrane protein 42 [Anticarsia gemmatalis]|uniref:transmembrane protein 42 n=1 Tax=Anticarsia gemmatalis TaxID=129554 RepID=UPI003F76FB91